MSIFNLIPSTSTVSEPLWEYEKRIAVRAIWEVAALADNVAPSLENIRRAKVEDPRWKAGYSEIMRRMIDVLKPTTARNINHINYDPALSLSASIHAQGRSHSQTRMDVISACNFIAGRYGIDNLAVGKS